MPRTTPAEIDSNVDDSLRHAHLGHSAGALVLTDPTHQSVSARSPAPSQERSRGDRLSRMQALRAAQVYDGTAFLGAGTVLVDGERIVGVEPGYPEPPGDADVTTYAGTLLPGLVDCHVHLVSNGDIGALERAGTATDEQLDAQIRESLAASAARGVTTVLDLGDSRYRTLEVRALPGLPRVLAAGPPLTVPDGHCHFLGGVALGVNGVRDQVAEHVVRGVDVLKVMASGGMITAGTNVFAAQFSEAELAALVAAGHQAGRKVLAHAHALDAVWHAIRAGVDGIEHFGCLTETGPEVSEELLEAVAAAGVTIDMTLGLDLSQMPPPDTLPPGIRAVLERIGLDFPTMYAHQVELAGRIRAHGIRLVTGTDAGAAPPKRHGGTALAIQTLVEAGYPVAEAVATATSDAAEYVGLAGVTGAVRAGLSADLLVVDDDLATDPGALGRPVAVLIRGATVPHVGPGAQPSVTSSVGTPGRGTGSSAGSLPPSA